MKWLYKPSFLTSILSLIVASVLLSGLTSPAFAAPHGHFSKVVWIVFENENADEVEKQPDFAKLTHAGASFTNFFAESHPSQPNYIAMIAGSALGVSSDRKVDLNENHVGDLLEKAGLDWRVYAENYPGNCFTGMRSGFYFRKHNPFMSFRNVTENRERCSHVTDTTHFMQDLADGTLPAFSMFIPNINNDGHNTSVAFAGRWLTANFGPIFSHPQDLTDTLFIITFDESETYFGPNQIFTVLIGGKIRPGTTSNVALNHTALLKMIEDEYSLGNLGRGDLVANPVTGIWR